MDLFVYGTLRFPEVLTALLGRVPPGTPASAAGWRVAALHGRVYPALVPDEHATAAGLVLAGLGAEEARRLDAFEGADYRLTAITLTDGRSCPAYVYLSPADVLTADWNPDRFRAAHLVEFVENCVRWRDGQLTSPATDW